MTQYLPAIEVDSAPAPTYALIWLHGLGADGSDFSPLVPELAAMIGRAVRFIFPHAPMQAVSCNGGYVMPSWYDIYSLAPMSRRIDEAGLVRSCSAVRDLIAREVARGIPEGNIFLVGFSQGGAVAYSTALSHPRPLGGVIALSTYLPASPLLQPALWRERRDLPVLVMHGSLDDVVAPALGRKAYDFLLGEGYAADWQDFPMGHQLCQEQVARIGQWLGQQMAVPHE